MNQEENKSIFSLRNAIATCLVFVLGIISRPSLEEIGINLKNRFINNSSVAISGCITNSRASKIYRVYNNNEVKDLLLEKIDDNPPNRSSLIISNNTNKTLTDVVISIVPLNEKYKNRIEYIFTEAASNAVEARKHYDFVSSATTDIRTIITKKMSIGDAVLVKDSFNGSLDFHVELTSNELTKRKIIIAGCDGKTSLTSNLTWYGFYLSTNGECQRSADENTSLECIHEWMLPEKFGKHLNKGNSVEITQIFNERIQLISDMKPKLIENSDPPTFKIDVINTKQ